MDRDTLDSAIPTITGTLHVRYIIASAFYNYLVGLGLAIVAFTALLKGGLWFVAVYFWLLSAAWIWLYSLRLVRTVRWFRLQEGVMVYRKLGSASNRTLLLSQIRKLQLVRCGKLPRIGGFNLVREHDGKRLFFAFFPDSGGQELLSELERIRPDLKADGGQITANDAEEEKKTA